MGNIGKGHGFNNCYVLIDKFFSRKFMTFCSWDGGDRKNSEKIPFKMYRNTINLFFRLIHLSDNDFTLTECEQFFKKVIHNSTRRSQSSMIWASKTKQKPKKLAYQMQVSSLASSTN